MKQKKNSWNHYPGDIKESFGFVYIITEIDTGMKYIGCKQFWSKRTLKPLKGKKNKRHKSIESDWKVYNTSSTIMQDKLKKKPKNYKKEMILVARTKTEMKAMEAYYQLQYYAEGNWDKLYNGYVGLRLRIR